MSESRRSDAVSEFELLNKLQRILNEGLFVASYKYALILALAELSVEKAVPADGTLALPLNELSERFISLYWRQAAPFAEGTLLAQNTGRQASVISRLADFRAHAPTLAAARRHPLWATLVREIGRLLIAMPLWKLQRVGADRLDFMYEERLIDRAIVLRPGIAAFFQRQFMIVQALVQMAWITFLHRLPPNRALLGSTGDLAQFLFGAERSGLRSIVEGLGDLQKAQCFYCDKRMSESSVAVDHFIPWSRYPRDLGHNFVLVHASCNQQKRDMLAAPVHLDRWVNRTMNESGALQQIFDEARFVSDADASMSVVEWSYENAERAGATVWVRGRETYPLSPEWRRFWPA